MEEEQNPGPRSNPITCHFILSFRRNGNDKWNFTAYLNEINDTIWRYLNKIKKIFC